MDERKIIYANGFRVAMGLMETQISFKVETPIINDEQVGIVGVEQQDVADIRLNPMLAKQLYFALKQQVEEYERQFGTLDVPTNLLPPTEGRNE